jgi:hypothetical protein
MADRDADLALARACVETDPEADPGPDGDDPWWRLTERSWEDPTGTLDIVLAICDLTDNIEVLAVVGAGAIEDLLTKHPTETLDRILAEAHRTPNFRTAFRCVWTTGMTPVVKDRVDAALAVYGGNL